MKSKQPRPVLQTGHSVPHSFPVTPGCPTPLLGGGVLDEFYTTTIIISQSLLRAAACL